MNRPIFLTAHQRRARDARWLLLIVLGTAAFVAALFFGLGYLISL